MLANATGPVAGVVTALAVAPIPVDRPEDLEEYARGVLVALVRMGLVRQIADARGELQRTEESDPRYQELFGRLMELEARRRSLDVDR